MFYRIPLNDPSWMAADNRMIVQQYLGLGAPAGAAYIDVPTSVMANPRGASEQSLLDYFSRRGLLKIREEGDLPARYGPYKPIPKALP